MTIESRVVRLAMQISLNGFTWPVKSTFLDARGSYLGQWLSMVFFFVQFFIRPSQQFFGLNQY